MKNSKTELSDLVLHVRTKMGHEFRPRADKVLEEHFAYDVHPDRRDVAADALTGEFAEVGALLVKELIKDGLVFQRDEHEYNERDTRLSNECDRMHDQIHSLMQGPPADLPTLAFCLGQCASFLRQVRDSLMRDSLMEDNDETT